MALYNMLGYGKMIADRVRMDAYVKALNQVITPDSVVLDIGTGTGIMALIACQFGARKVYAIEPDLAIHVARELAAANGYADRIEFIRDLSTRVTLPEQANVIVSDLRGVLPLFQHHIPSIVDARRRLLGPNGILIPRSDTLWAALVQAPELYSEYTAIWASNPYHLTMQPARRLAVNTWAKAYLEAQQILTEPHIWTTLDYTAIESPDIRGTLNWTMTRAATAHGFAVWFNTELADNAGFSNAPGLPGLIYGQGVFLWETPIALQAGDTVLITLQAELSEEEYVWSWNTNILGPGDPARPKASFKQSTAFGTPLTSLLSVTKEWASELQSILDSRP